MRGEMLQINVCLTDKLFENLLFKYLWSKSLIAFPGIITERLIAIDDETSDLEQRGETLGGYFGFFTRCLRSTKDCTSGKKQDSGHEQTHRRFH